jgi:hypothetical protein
MGATQLLVAVCLLYLVTQTAAQAATPVPTTAALVVPIPVPWVGLQTRRPRLPVTRVTAVPPAATVATAAPVAVQLVPRMAGQVVTRPVVLALPTAVRVLLDQVVPVEL